MKMTLEKLHIIAGKIIDKVHSLKSDTATVVALHGDLGAGKTTLTQEIAKQLKISESVISPTFVIIKKYNLPAQAGVVDKNFKYLIHIDAYRLNSSEELLKLGWQEIFEDKSNLIIIEWPENVSDCIPKDVCTIKLSHTDESTRSIEF